MMQQSRGCPACHSDSNAYICATCLTKLLTLYRNQTESHANSLLPSARTRAKAGVNLNREHIRVEAKYAALRSDVTILRSGVKDLDEALFADRQSLELKRRTIASRRSSLRLAQSTLNSAAGRDAASLHALLPSLAALRAHDAAIEQHLRAVYAELADTRRILLAELIEAFDIHVSNEGKTASISGLWVPDLQDLAKLPSHHLNATVQLLLSFVRLAAFYLGVKLPFPTSGSSTKATIRAAPGSPNLIKYPRTYALHGSSQPSSGSGAKDGSIGKSPNGTTAAANYAASLTTGLQMLAYNAVYMLQGCQSSREAIHVTAAQADMLRTLVTLLDCPALGFVDHVTTRERAKPLDTTLEDYPFAKFVQDLERRDKEADVSVRRGTYVVVDEETAKDIDPFVLDRPVKEEEGWDLL